MRIGNNRRRKWEVVCGSGGRNQKLLVSHQPWWAFPAAWSRSRTFHEPCSTNESQVEDWQLIFIHSSNSGDPQSKLPQQKFNKASFKDSLGELLAQSSSLAFQDDSVPVWRYSCARIQGPWLCAQVPDCDHFGAGAVTWGQVWPSKIFRQ